MAVFGSFCMLLFGVKPVTKTVLVEYIVDLLKSSPGDSRPSPNTQV